MNDIRGILTDEEIEEIKSRVVDGLINGVFLDTVTETDEHGQTYMRRELNWQVAALVKETATGILKDEVERIAAEVIAPRTQEAAEALMERFVKQTREIADKVNWYWSIK